MSFCSMIFSFLILYMTFLSNRCRMCSSLCFMRSTQVACFLRLFTENISQPGRRCQRQWNLGTPPVFWVPNDPLTTHHLRLQSRSLQPVESLTFFSLKNACQYIYIYIFNLGVSKMATIYLRVLLDVWLLEFSSPQPLSLHLTRERPYQEGIKGTT